MRSICLIENIQLGYAIKTIVSQEKDCKKKLHIFLIMTVSDVARLSTLCTLH